VLVFVIGVYMLLQKGISTLNDYELPYEVRRLTGFFVGVEAMCFSAKKRNGNNHKKFLPFSLLHSRTPDNLSVRIPHYEPFSEMGTSKNWRILFLPLR